MSRIVGPAITWIARFPRVSGDEPAWVTLLVVRAPFSPRERG